MKFGFYPRLALTGMSKNKKTYLPYLFTCIAMIMMFYIVAFLSRSPLVESLKGGRDLQSFLSLGVYIIGFFACIFLFYTNSFLIRRRKREFGLYNVLGMGKGNLARILLWESFFLYTCSLVSGLALGILFSKFTELCIFRLLGETPSFAFWIDVPTLGMSAMLFGVIFLLILLNALRQSHISKPIELLHSENVGEKPPKANWFVALAGALLLAVAYYLAVATKNPLEALGLFFVAVLLVIAATYLLFIAGSVVFCRILQKNKRYYYKTSHFISVSSMVYRMKRNGAGLASICVLSTMVLVMISTTSCMYVGKDDMLQKRYPQDLITNVAFPDQELTDDFIEIADQTFADYGVPVTERVHFRYLNVSTYLGKNQFLLNPDFDSINSIDFSVICDLYIVPYEYYSALTNDSQTLADGEALLYISKKSWKPDTIDFNGKFPMQVKEISGDFLEKYTSAYTAIYSNGLLVVPDMQTLLDISQMLTEEYQSSDATVWEYYGLNGDPLPDDTAIAIYDTVRHKQYELVEGTDSAVGGYHVYSKAFEKSSFFSLYSSLLFLGILLSIVFLMASALMMYYKQLSEGYEDQSRFEILQKVGMTKREIRKSINSQVLTIFFLPLIVAGIHTAFAFPMIRQILLAFGISNIRLFVTVDIVCFLGFALIYTLIYKLTARSYYHIVSIKD